MTHEEETNLQLLSDGPLLEEAVAFAKGKQLPPAQINGLLTFSKYRWSELEQFVRHQAERNWPPQRDGNTHATKVFYVALRDRLNSLRRECRGWGFVIEGPAKKEKERAIASRLAQEFIQHLTAEMLYQEGGD